MFSLKADLLNTTLEDFEQHFDLQVTILPVEILQATGAIPIPARTTWGEPVYEDMGWNRIGWVWVDSASIIYRVDVHHVALQAAMSWSCRVGLNQSVPSGFDLRTARYRAGRIQISLFDWDAYFNLPRAFYIPKVWLWMRSCWGDAVELVEVIPDTNSSTSQSVTAAPPIDDSISTRRGGQPMHESNRWLIEQAIDMGKTLAPLEGEWLEKRRKKNLPDPIDPLDSMKRVIAQERKKRRNNQ